MAEEQDEGFTLPTKCDCIAMETGAVVKHLQASLFPVFAKGSYLSNFLQNTLKSNQVEINTDSRTLRPIAKLKEPRDLFALPKELDCPQQAARWPSECQVLEDRVHHIDYIPPVPEQYYRPSGREVQPKPIGEEQGEVVFQYYPMSAVNYFSRSSVGGSKYFVDASPSDNPEDLRFESRFESGNLAKVVKITESYYELYLRTDLYTNKHMQWFYFRVENARTNVKYRFSIVNLSKDESLYNEGMRPLLYSTKDARLNNVGWRRCGDNITYYKNDNQNGEEDQSPSFTLTFNVEFPYDNDLVYLAHCYPYTYTDLQDYLIRLQNNPLKSSYCKLRLLCRSLAGNNVYYLTITAPSNSEEPKKKRAIVITARVHPGETPSSWMMKGFIDFLTGESEQAKELREKFIFKLVPMLNPDGVIVGNNRCSLTGRDLNRQYRTVIRETYPSVWHTKLMIRRLMEECGVEMYCDLHAHSRKHNVFIYGCENKRIGDKRLQEQVFPLMLHKNAADKFSFENCKFRIQRSKEGTGRVVVWMMGVANSYTMEASFGGSLLGSRCNTHFHTQDYEQMGRYFCETLLDYCDQEPSKERLRTKIMNRLLQEGSNADEPTNIVLSDYSSDEGDTSSSSEEERVEKRLAELECCSPVPAPPPSPVLPRREHRLFKESVVERSPPPPRRILQVHRTTIDLATTDLSSDLCEPPTEVESGDDSLSWRQANKKNKSDSPVRNAWKYPDKSSEKCDMPPELIVTPAQVYETQIATELSEKLEANDGSYRMYLIQSFNYLPHEEVSTVPAIKEETAPVHPPVPNPTAELQPVDKLRTHMWHQMRCPPVTRLQSRTVDEMSAELQGKVGSSLRQKLWTGIPCSCHISTTETYWSKGIWATSNESLLRSCSQKLSILQQSYTQNQSRSEAKALRKKLSRLRKYASETMGKYAGRTRHNSESDTSPADEIDTEASESRKRLKKKPKYRNSHTARSLPSKQDDFNTSRSEKLSSQRYSLSSASGNKSQQQQKPPSLKWKFRKGGLVATAAATINSRKMDHFESASDTETNDKQKNSGKKKKKRKCGTAKKTKRVSSASKQSPKKTAKANLSW